MNSKSLPLYAGLAVVLLAGLFLVGRSLLDPQTVRPQATAPAAPMEELHPRQVEAREALRNGRLDQAVELLRQVPEDAPSYLMALNDLGVIYERMGQPEQSVALADRVLALRPEDPEAHYVRARGLAALQRYDEAELDCLRTLEIAPRHVAARYGIGLIRVASGHLDRGIDSYLRAMEVDRSEDRVLEAVRDLAELHEQRPELPDVHYALAFFANTLGSSDQELEELEHFLALNPQGPAVKLARDKATTLRRLAGSP